MFTFNFRLVNVIIHISIFLFAVDEILFFGHSHSSSYMTNKNRRRRIITYQRYWILSMRKSGFSKSNYRTLKLVMVWWCRMSACFIFVGGEFFVPETSAGKHVTCGKLWCDNLTWCGRFHANIWRDIRISGNLKVTRHRNNHIKSSFKLNNESILIRLNVPKTL